MLSSCARCFLVYKICVLCNLLKRPTVPMPTRPRAKPSKPLQRESRRPSPQSTEGSKTLLQTTKTTLTLAQYPVFRFGFPEDNADLDAAYQSAVKFEQDNQDAIDKTGSRLASSDSVKELEGKVRDFATSSQVMMKVLDEIRGIHPFIGVLQCSIFS